MNVFAYESNTLFPLVITDKQDKIDNVTKELGTVRENVATDWNMANLTLTILWI